MAVLVQSQLATNYESCPELSLLIPINKKNMQSNATSPTFIRNSYGFIPQEQFLMRSPQNKGFPTTHQFPQHISQQESLSSSIKNLQNKYDIIESPGRKKMTTGQNSPTLTSTMAGNDNRFRGQFLNNSEVRTQDQSNEQLLRGSCSNILRKFQTSNMASSLRNTTHFNPINKFNTPNEPKRPVEQPNSAKNTFTAKTIPQSSSFLKSSHKLKSNTTGSDIPSRTPPKFLTQKKLDQSTNLSKTPTKYKNIFENNSKNSAISKGSIETQQKKTFKSLNEIVQSKAKQKLALQTSKVGLKKSKRLKQFELGVVLGKGKFGEVFLSRHHEAGFIVALKKVVKSKVVEFKMVDQFCKEIQLHSCLDHPNIVKFYGCFQDKDDIYLVMEYMNGGTLFDCLNEVSYLNVRDAVEYLRDIIQALVYMHQKSIAHRDIKPQNIVISSQGVAKLCDFGWSAVVQTSRKTYCGTFDYAPPQILQRKNYDASVDIWCIGVLTYELLTGRVPFEGEQRNVVMQKIVNVDKNKIDYPVDLPAEAKEFIESLVQKDPNLRPKTQDLLKFKLFNLYPPKVNNKPKK